MTDALKFDMACQIIQSSFSPLGCECKRTENDGICVRLYDDSNTTHLLVKNIAPDKLTTIRSVSQLALEIKQALASSTMRNKVRARSSGLM